MRSRPLVQLGPEHAGAALEYCRSAPHQCTFIAGWIEEGGLSESPLVPRGWLLAERLPRGPVTGLAYFSDTGIVMPALGSSAGEQDVVRIGRRNPSAVRVLVGERGQVSRIWRGLSRAGARARQIRDQRAYVVTRAGFREAGTLPLVPADDQILEQLVAASAAMAREEAKDDPQSRNPGLFKERIRERVRRGRDLVYVEQGRLLFKSNVAAISPLAGQIEGIYTQPSARGAGLGTRGTSAITAWVLDRAEQAFLLVNEDNFGAQRIYERLGYEHVLESQTIFLAP